MKKLIKHSTLVISLLLAAPAFGLDRDPVDYVNPFIGTDGIKSVSLYGGMIPAVTRPFGMIQWTAMTHLNKISQCPYRYRDRKLIGFLGTRQPAVWMGDYGDFSIMPGTGKLEHRFQKRGVPFSHKNETATPYYYSVLFRGIKVEITAHERSSIFRIKFLKPGRPYIVIDASRDQGFPGHLQIEPEKNRVRGWNSDRDSAPLGPPLPNFKGYFVMEFNKSVTGYGTYRGDSLSEGELEVTGEAVGGYVRFAEGTKEVLVRIGTSLISYEQAEANLREEIPDWDFEALRDATRQAWNRQLSRILVEGGDEDMRTIFYTAMFHAHLYPRIFSEGGRYYSAFDDRVHQGTAYNDYSLWDTFRAEHPLLIFTASERVSDMVNSLLQMYKEGGYLPKWPNPTYTGIMIGSHADSVIADAWVKGIRGFDLELAYEAVRHDAFDPPEGDREKRWGDRDPWTSVESRGGLSWYLELGYVPADKTAESVSRTLEFAYDDFCAAQLAKAAGRMEDYEILIQHSRNYRNLYNPETGFFQARNADGSWAEGGFTEGLKWHYLFTVMQDIPGMVEMMGGPREVEKKLDKIFMPVMRHYRYLHSNEPSHHYPFLYDYIGRAWKTQRQTAYIAKKYYWNRPFGLIGNDDCGQMSAWFIFSTIGFYPVTPCTDLYAISSPRWDRVEIKIGKPYPEAVFIVRCKNQSPKNIYIQSATLNGEPLTEPFLRHEQIIRGGELVFEMGPRPNKEWGTAGIQ